MRQSSSAAATHTPAIGKPATPTQAGEADRDDADDDQIAERAAGALHRPVDQRRRRRALAFRKQA